MTFSISREFSDELLDEEFRYAYMAAQLRARISVEMKAMRANEGWSQADLGEVLDTPQPVISRMEKRDGPPPAFQTLLSIARAYGVGLIIDFVPYVEWLRRTADLSPANTTPHRFAPDDLAEITETDISASVSEPDRRRRVRGQARSHQTQTPARAVKMGSTASSGAIVSFGQSSVTTGSGAAILTFERPDNAYASL